mmetsp:Transcript_2507/g.7501  ORF Transcript_2507/g.7501 Transcript_2507/m.7501 type:complete len:536 (+) Transcript_2507:121-1728(+)|eukprot:CAMPEP_0198723570 /NCGR_PEP_ID=MMETSP1475-20131203/1084_1 /TAXON_ID= ORGANISM="Unidentified sp., Strain CCMP1999" /NCGR_SAMPLE_ID=MMETSP1475 /ASSEMBLY_ACC=CAM_ASM_001111 /LENGTH=535 /DNA_ID=CAMNT_0044484765 /DNA_START=61 /DNA_END=1668 /DNA_ORIENTATION=-
MAQDYYSVVPKRHAPVPLRTTPEARYWAKFHGRTDLTLPASVTRVEFAPTEPHDFVVSASTRLTVVDGKTNKILRTIGSFKDVAYGGSFKRDGRLISAGCENGIVQVFDVHKRALLRVFEGHTGAVRTAMFSFEGLRLVSGSDDRTVRVWDLPQKQQLTTLDGHGDYVRAQTASKQAPHLWATGCYDHKFRLYDLRTQGVVLTLNHEYPVESILLLPGGGLAVTAGGPEVRIFDLFAGGRLLRRLTNHAKAVTSICVDPSGSRLLTGGLDEQIKVHDINTFEVQASMSFPGQILSIDMSPNGSRLAAGLASGVCAIRNYQTAAATNRSGPAEDFATRRRSDEVKMFMKLARGEARTKIVGPVPGSRRYFLRGKHEGPREGDEIVGAEKRVKLQPYDHLLRKFAYGAALDKAVRKGRAAITAAVLEDLIHRNGLEIAVSNRSPDRLLPLLMLVEKNISNPRYTEVMIELANIIMDVYAKVLGRFKEVDQAVTRVRNVVQRELQTENELMRLMGLLDIATSGASDRVSPELTELTAV